MHGCLQGAERNVKALLDKLECLRAKGLNLSSSIPDVIDIISEINQERSSHMEGRHGYVSSAYVCPISHLWAYFAVHSSFYPVCLDTRLRSNPTLAWKEA